MTERVVTECIEEFLFTLDKLGITHEDICEPNSKGYISTDELIKYWDNQGVIEYDI